MTTTKMTTQYSRQCRCYDGAGADGGSGWAHAISLCGTRVFVECRRWPAGGFSLAGALLESQGTPRCFVFNTGVPFLVH